MIIASVTITSTSPCRIGGMILKIPVGQFVATARTAAPPPNARAMTVAAVVEVEHEGAGNEDRRKRVVQHSVDRRRQEASGHELIEGRHDVSPCLLISA